MRWALVDFGHAFYRPLLRRIVIIALVLGWAAVEFTSGATGWAIFFLALAAYTGWGFFLSGQVGAPSAGPDAPESGGSQPADEADK